MSQKWQSCPKIRAQLLVMGTMRVISKFFEVKRVSVKKKVWFGFGAGCCAAFGDGRLTSSVYFSLLCNPRDFYLCFELNWVATFTNSNLPSRCWYTSLSFSRAEARSHPQQPSHHDPNSSRAGWWEGRRLVNLEPGWVNSGKSVEQIKKHRYNLSGS